MDRRPHRLNRRTFLKAISAAGALEVARTGSWLSGTASAQTQHGTAQQHGAAQHGAVQPGRIVNEYTLFLPDERESLSQAPAVLHLSREQAVVLNGSTRRPVAIHEEIDGWQLLAIARINGTMTAVFEKHVTHRGAIAYVTQERGTIGLIPKYVGQLASIRPRQIANGGPLLVRPAHYAPGPDTAGNFILSSDEDPCFENVAALGEEYIGWTLIANEQGGPEQSLFLDAEGKSRELRPGNDSLWAPDEAGATFDPHPSLPRDNPQLFDYVHGYSKRTLLGGYLPVADIGVWNPVYHGGYECMVLLPQKDGAQFMGRVRAAVDGEDRPEIKYVNSTAESFFSELLGIWNHWHDFYDNAMAIDIPDEWLANAARAGITLSRCSYQGLHPTYQIGEGAYTKKPARSHGIFPVAHYEFVWAQQLWGLTAEVEPYFQFYLDNYILPDGNFDYNTQDQVEAPLNADVFLWNAARAYDYTGDAAAFEQKLPILERMLQFVLARYEYSKQHFALTDRRYGLIWGSPEADLGSPQNDYPQSHPYYYQNAVWAWRGLVEHSRVLSLLGTALNKPEYTTRSRHYADVAAEMRPLIERSIAATIAASTPARQAAGITPFDPFDTQAPPKTLESYENHRFMMDFFSADWGDPALDLGHLKHREIAGMQIVGMNTDGAIPRTSNFMSHGTLAVKIRQQDYRPYLLTLYGLACFTSDNGCFYSPEDAYLPGGHPLEGGRFAWSAVVNSVLQPAMGLRWLLCYEESGRDVCHLQKAAPKHWFATGEKIRVERCPTRFGLLSWTTEAISDDAWSISLDVPPNFRGDLVVHVHPPKGQTLRSASIGTISQDAVTISKTQLAQGGKLDIQIKA